MSIIPQGYEAAKREGFPILKCRIDSAYDAAGNHIGDFVGEIAYFENEDAFLAYIRVNPYEYWKDVYAIQKK